MKTCGKCRAPKPESDFTRYKSGQHEGRLASYCKACNREAYSEWRRANPERVAAQTERRRVRALADGRGMKQRYGLTTEAWAEMASQGCRICGEAGGLHVDHDHACCPGQQTCGGCIRGALCGSCNRAIGLMQDNPDRLIAAATYLLQRVNVLKGV